MGCCGSKPEAVVVPEAAPVPAKPQEPKPLQPPNPPPATARLPTDSKPAAVALFTGDIQHVVETGQHARRDLGHGLEGAALAGKLLNHPPTNLSTTLLYGSTWRAMQEPQQLVQLAQEDPDVSDAGQLMASAVSLAWLQELAAHPEHGALTPAQLQQQVAAPATQQTRCRYMNVVGAAAQPSSSQSSSQPAYWIWLEPSWHHSIAHLMRIVGSHVQAMEPNCDPRSLAVWLECVCCHAHASSTTLEGVRAGAREWLSRSSYAKPTLVCLQKVQPDFKQACFPEQNDEAGLPGSVDHNTAFTTPSGHSNEGRCLDKNNMTGMAAYSQQQPVSHLPVMTLWRSMNGLHGFHKAWFDTVNMLYLD